MISRGGSVFSLHYTIFLNVITIVKDSRFHAKMLKPWYFRLVYVKLVNTVRAQSLRKKCLPTQEHRTHVPLPSFPLRTLSKEPISTGGYGCKTDSFIWELFAYCKWVMVFLIGEWVLSLGTYYNVYNTTFFVCVFWGSEKM